MPTITLKNIPPPLHRRLKQRAEGRHRSLNREIIATLEAAVGGGSHDVETLLADAAAFRGRLGFTANDADLKKFRQTGRA
jgi:plasmid stability protein